MAGSQPGMFRIHRAGTCEMQYTQIIRAHCVSAVRSRKFLVASVVMMVNAGRRRNTYTGMKMVNTPYQPVQTSPYWEGSTTKKLTSKAKWSDFRVGVRVRNSRSAAKETIPKRMMVAFGP